MPPCIRQSAHPFQLTHGIHFPEDKADFKAPNGVTYTGMGSNGAPKRIAVESLMRLPYRLGLTAARSARIW